MTTISSFPAQKTALLQSGLCLSHSNLTSYRTLTKDVIVSMSILDDSQYLVTGSKDRSIAGWNIADKSEFFRISDAHTEPITSVSISKDSTWIVSASEDKLVAIWNFLERTLFHRHETAHTDAVTSIAISSDSNFFVSGSKDPLVSGRLMTEAPSIKLRNMRKQKQIIIIQKKKKIITETYKKQILLLKMPKSTR